MLSPKATEYFVGFAGTLSATGSHASARWSTDDEADAWLVSDGDSLYLVSESGEVVFVSDLPGHHDEVGSYAGLAVMPRISKSSSSDQRP